MSRQPKLGALTDAVAMIADGATLAVGGRAHRRMPMALLREIARQRKQGLHIVRLDRAMNLDVLKETKSTFVAGDERVLRARLEAAARGLPFMPLEPHVNSVLGSATEAVDDPFGGAAVLVAAALRPDVAILHAHVADCFGNVALDADSDTESLFDATLARAAARVIVSVEQIVSEETIRHSGARVLLGSENVACVVEAPYGAHPCACDARYAHDAGTIDESSVDHASYLQAVGSRRLFSLTRRLASRL
jgi:glutaconate CoA-transferase, subunit A